ncbi:MAG: polyphosphate kinase 2 family protein [Planctomycetaceae bacterium]
MCRHRLIAGQEVRLSELTTQGKDLHPDRSEAKREFRKLKQELFELQCRLYAEGRQQLLVVLQATDTGGKDGTIRDIFSGINPQGVRVTSFKAPTAHERQHDFLWRIHQAVPAAGMIGVFNRSHYEDVLIVRVDDLVSPSVWEPRYETINQFEQLLVQSHTKVLKFFLHISQDEQKQRLESRLSEPRKHWKFNIGDLRKRAQWDAYQQAYQDMLSRCTTPEAPWFVIPADQKWYRNLIITQAVVHTLREMDPQYPEQSDDLSGVVVH